jgi:hypothetical protein
MIKNRTTQLIFQTMYCTFGLVAFVVFGFLFFGLDKLGKKKEKQGMCGISGFGWRRIIA